MYFSNPKSRIHTPQSLLCALWILCGFISVAAAEPTLEQRLARICEQLEKQRQNVHVPGFAIAIIKDDQVILSRGFGLRDIENNLPVTDETLFAIGSTTKAFTATVIGMLMDEGKMSWDDHPRKFLPDFKLNDEVANEQVTIRDLLCHRTGLASNDLLWYASGSTREEILQTVSSAELLYPFREKWNYNNVMFLAAGMAAGRAADSNWDSLIADRIFKPLNMTSSDTSITIASKSQHLSKGYEWDEERKQHDHKRMRNLDNIGPAGSINSCAKDMAQWVRFLLNNGMAGENRLISEERLNDTWTKQIDVAGMSAGYGLGWLMRQLNGRSLIEHSGGIDGFGAQVAIMPDEKIGYVLLTNVTASALQPMSVNIVFDTLLGEWSEAEPAINLAEAQDYLGKYHFDMLGVDVTALIQNGKLAVDVPGQMVYELKPPDESGKWFFAMTDQIAVSFVRNEDKDVIGMKMYQAGLEFELPREGIEQPEEITAAEAQKYLGSFHSEILNAEVTVLHRKGRLAVDVPKQMVFDLHLPDAEGRRVFRATNTISVKFNADETNAITSMTMTQDGVESVLPRVEAAASDATAALPSLDDVLALLAKGHGTANISAIRTLRMTGTLQFVHQGATGTITIVSEGLDRYAQHLDLGDFGSIHSALNGKQAWSDSSFGEFEELKGEYIQQMRLQHPLAFVADARTFFKSIAVNRVDAVDGRKAYVLDASISDGTSCRIFVDAESGLVVKEELRLRTEGAGIIGTEVTCGDYRDVEGVRLPMRFTIANEFNGKMIARIEKVETNIDLPGDAFILKPHSP